MAGAGRRGQPGKEKRNRPNTEIVTPALKLARQQKKDAEAAAAILAKTPAAGSGSVADKQIPAEMGATPDNSVANRNSKKNDQEDSDSDLDETTLDQLRLVKKLADRKAELANKRNREELGTSENKEASSTPENSGVPASDTNPEDGK